MHGRWRCPKNYETWVFESLFLEKKRYHFFSEVVSREASKFRAFSGSLDWPEKITERNFS